MKRLFAWSVIVLMTAISACTPALQSTGAPAQSPAVPTKSATLPAPSASPTVMPTVGRLALSTVEPTLAPHPLMVKVKLDDTLTASAVISSTGGTLSVQAADGTKFTLGIPKDAVFQDEKVTLTPVQGVEGLPFSGGLVGSVQMAPEGLRLFQPANLTIETPRATPPSGYSLVAFAYHQTGEGFYLTPAQTEGNKITMPVWHFSGSGVASGTPAEIQAQQQRVPADPEDAMQQRMQDYLTQQHQLTKEGKASDPELLNKIKAYLREYYERFIKPQLAAASQDCEAGKSILPRALIWARQVALLGFDDELRAETDRVMQAMEEAIVNCYNKEYDECVIDKDIKHKVAMLTMLRQATMLSPANGGGVLGRLDQTKVDKCPPMNYRVDQASGPGRLTGTICGTLSSPFMIQFAGADFSGVYTFTPNGVGGGTWEYAGTFGGLATNTASGAYTIDGKADGPPFIQRGASSVDVQTSVGGGQGNWPAETIQLQPLKEGCK